MNLRYRMLLLDLDGTLAGENDAISERTLRALRRARRAGCVPVVCTGRTRYTARRIVERLDSRGTGIFLNGAIVWDLDGGQLLSKTPLTEQTTCGAIELVRAQGLAPLCFAADEDDRWVHTDGDAGAFPSYLRDYPERLVRCRELLSELPGAPVSVEAYGPPESIRALESAWRQAFDGAGMVYTWTLDDGSAMGAHIHSARASKAGAAQAVCDRLGIAREETLAIGDEKNDVELLRWAGMGVAMGDGCPEAIAAADHVTAPFTEDGAAQAIERFLGLGADEP